MDTRGLRYMWLLYEVHESVLCLVLIPVVIYVRVAGGLWLYLMISAGLCTFDIYRRKMAPVRKLVDLSI